MKRLYVVPLVAAVSLMIGAVPAFAWQKDPDTPVDSSAVTNAVTQLLAPATTTGDTDPALPGIGLDAVGVDSLSNPPADDPPAGNTLWVDQDGPVDGDCPVNAYTSIQDAVNASGPNDTIKVCPDTYTEQVKISGHVHDGLTLVSVTPLAAVIQWPGVVNPSNHQLVDVKDADHVTIKGFTITGPFTSGGCSNDRHEGVRYENAFNGRVEYNHITLIRDSLTALWGCQQGDAVSIGERLPTSPAPPPPPPYGAPASAQVDHNLIDKYQKNGVQVVNPGTFAQVQNNTITASTEAAMHASIASNGVVVFLKAGATVDHNVVSENQYSPTPLSTGIILDEAPSGSSSVDYNQVFNNDYGIETDTVMNLDVSHNDVHNNLADAITVCGDPTQGCGSATGVVVRRNDINNNGGSGILLIGAKNNLLKLNRINGNGTTGPDTTDGIRVDSTSTGNNIVSNRLGNNVTYDCHDDSVGTGTAGTANTWNNNVGATQNRPGLCAPPSCQEADGNGDFSGQQSGNFSADSDGCKDGDQDSVQSNNRGDGKDFHSTWIDSMSYDPIANTITITGLGLSGGTPVSFVFVAQETGLATPGWVSLTFSDGYVNAGNLVDGSVLLH